MTMTLPPAPLFPSFTFTTEEGTILSGDAIVAQEVAEDDRARDAQRALDRWAVENSECWSYADWAEFDHAADERHEQYMSEMGEIWEERAAEEEEDLERSLGG